MPEWKKALSEPLREPNAAGWVAFMVLVLVIGVVSLYRGAKHENRAETPALSRVAR